LTDSPHEAARFTTGSTLLHVITMAGAGAAGLVAVFAVDLLNLLYISVLGAEPIAAAIGFSGVIGFFQTSISIGLTIGIGAVVSREIGAGRDREAAEIATSSLAIMVTLGAVVGSGTAIFLGRLLSTIGAAGETLRLATLYLSITTHSLPLLAVGMGCAALLRSVGEARRAMNITLLAAAITAVLDPILIFLLHLDLTGAAVSTVFSRVGVAAFGLFEVRSRGLLAPFNPARIWMDGKRLSIVAAPAVLTNLATPVGGAFVTHAMSAFGTPAVAAQATIDRLTPVAFGLVYAVSGAVGPILSQNLGAGLLDRVRSGLRDSFLFVGLAVATAWLILALAQGLVVDVFSATGDTARLVRLFCSWFAAGYFFIGALYVANAAFNNLGFPLLSTAFNWGRATLGTIPFVMIGAWYGPAGVLAGQAAGALVFGTLASIVALRITSSLQRGTPGPAGFGAAISAGSGHAALAALTTRSSAPR
jgi:Na+-driven multidrug efflux pump